MFVIAHIVFFKRSSTWWVYFVFENLSLHFLSTLNYIEYFWLKTYIFINLPFIPVFDLWFCVSILYNMLKFFSNISLISSFWFTFFTNECIYCKNSRKFFRLNIFNSILHYDNEAFVYLYNWMHELNINQIVSWTETAKKRINILHMFIFLHISDADQHELAHLFQTCFSTYLLAWLAYREVIE